MDDDDHDDDLDFSFLCADPRPVASASPSRATRVLVVHGVSFTRASSRLPFVGVSAQREILATLSSVATPVRVLAEMLGHRYELQHIRSVMRAFRVPRVPVPARGDGRGRPAFAYYLPRRAS